MYCSIASIGHADIILSRQIVEKVCICYLLFLLLLLFAILFLFYLFSVSIMCICTVCHECFCAVFVIGICAAGTDIMTHCFCFVCLVFHFCLPLLFLCYNCVFVIGTCAV